MDDVLHLNITERMNVFLKDSMIGCLPDFSSKDTCRVEWKWDIPHKLKTKGSKNSSAILISNKTNFYEHC